jgi:hypothetical protein
MGSSRAPAAARRRRRVVALVLFACCACYDSTWGDAKRAQQAAAARSTPAAIHGTQEKPVSPAAAARTLHVRMRPSARYLAEVVDAPKQIAELVDDANAVLEPDLRVRLAVDATVPWSHGNDEDIEAALAALTADDPGHDVDWVVGMVGAVGRQTESLHVTGYAPLLGRHFVVRAATRLGERDAIESAFKSLSDDDRARLLHARKRHRALAVFLHELGHSLGALHEQDKESLMNPVYAPERTGFGEGAIALMRAALDAPDEAAAARAQLALLRGGAAAAWLQADREEEIAHLEAMLRPAPPAVEPAKAPIVGLPDADRGRLERAESLLQAGAAGSAYAEAHPLFAAYPNVYAVQDLRCQLATIRWLAPAALAAECAELKRLSAALDAGALDASRP